MTINKNITTKNYSVRANRKIEYIVIHYTGNDGDTAKANTDYFKNVNRNASAHYFVDENSVWQCVDDKNISWHCGCDTGYRHQYCRNMNSIGIELCSRKRIGKFYFDQKTIDNAIALTKQIMNEYNIPNENVIRHFDVTGKICPEPFVSDEGAWASFKERLMEKEKIKEYTDINDIAWELQERGIVSDTKGLIEDVSKEPNGRLYWLARKACQYIRENE